MRAAAGREIHGGVNYSTVLGSYGPAGPFGWLVVIQCFVPVSQFSLNGLLHRTCSSDISWLLELAARASCTHNASVSLFIYLTFYELYRLIKLYATFLHSL